MMKSPGTSELLHVQSNQVKCPPPPPHTFQYGLTISKNVFSIHACVMIIVLELNLPVFIETEEDFLIYRRDHKCMQYNRFHFYAGSLGLRSTWFDCKKFFLFIVTKHSGLRD